MEALIDLVSTTSGVPLIEVSAFKKAAGGALANVTVGLARLGTKAGFIGKVGDDHSGHFLARVLCDNGVDTSRMRYEAVPARIAPSERGWKGLLVGV